MRRYFKYGFVLIVVLLFVSCEDFFTTNWFQGAADISDLSSEEAINSGDTAIMQEVFDQILVEAAAATGEEAAELYMEAAELAMGISGLSDPSSLMDVLGDTGSEGGGEGEGDMFSLLSDSDFDLDALEDVSLMVANAEAASPGSVSPDLWLFSAAGSYAAAVNDAGDQDVEDFLGDDPVGDNQDINDSVQALVNAMDVLPQETVDELLNNQADLEADGIVFP